MASSKTPDSHDPGPPFGGHTQLAQIQGAAQADSPAQMTAEDRASSEIMNDYLRAQTHDRPNTIAASGESGGTRIRGVRLTPKAFSVSIPVQDGLQSGPDAALRAN